ncbi:site-specific DNA-methyltransferase [Kingella oralis]|jgi:type III restriction-modification system ecoP15I enzyme mod
MTARDDLFSRPAPSEERLYLLKRQFPECFDKNGAFVPERLAESLRSDGLPVQKEYYSLNWLGKSYAKMLRDAPPETLLAEDSAHNRQPENAASQNLLLKGDNLEILKHLKHAYAGAVKMIYIDPPYNTGSDGFVYQDDRRFTPEQLARLGGMDLDEACRVLEFTAKKSNSHSAWLTFMYPRLYIARELLREDGVIFISIDDNEQAQLKILCDEVFGEENFVGELVWNNVTDNNPTNIAIEHEYILCYSKSKINIENQWKSSISEVKNLLCEIEKELIDKYSDEDTLQAEYSKWFRTHKNELWPLENYKFIDKNGIYSGERGVHNPGKEGYRYDIIHPLTNKACKQPLMGYRFPKDTMQKMIDEGKIIFGKTEDKLVEIKVYAKDYKQKFSSVINLDGRAGANELKELFANDGKIFNNPKTIKLLIDIFSFVVAETDLILDFFAGSGTTAHAVMQLNAEDGENGRRRFILAQLPEPTDKKSEAYKAGYETIFQITQARLEKAAAKIRADHPHYTGDLGFKIFTTVPRFQAASDEAFDPQQPLLPESIRADLNSEQLDTLLTTWCVYDGCPLTAPVRPLDLAGYTAHWCGGNVYFMAAGCTSQTVKALIEKLDSDADFAPERVIFYGANMASAMQRELAQAVEGYANKKSLKLNVLARY